jgi:hypothetical protein
MPSTSDPVVGPETAKASPTGTPKLPVSVIGYITIGITVALAVLVSLVGIYPDSKALQVALAVVTALAGVLGIASPGLRKTAVVLALVLLPTLSGCVTIERIGAAAKLAAPGVLDCGQDAVTGALPGMLSEAAKALGTVIAGGSFDVEPIIDKLIEKGGPFMACAIAELLKAWEQSGPGAGVEALPLPQQRLRLIAAHVGQTHLLARGYCVR